MRQRDNSVIHSHLKQPSKAIRHAQLDNIAIVPASMLPFPETLHQVLTKLPKGAVFLCHTQDNRRQQELLERVEETFRQHGHTVKSMSVGEMYKAALKF